MNRVNRRLLSTGSRLLQKFEAGQPTFETRPHLIQKGDITPGISAEEYFARRQRIMDQIPDKSLVIVPGNVTQYASNSVFYQFRQDPNFQYLTGFLEPDSALLLHRESSDVQRAIMFVPRKNAHAEMWEGVRTGTKGAIDVFNADEAYSTEEINSVLKKLAPQVERIYTDFAVDKTRLVPQFGTNILKTVTEHFPTSTQVRSANEMVEAMRMVKTEAEIDCLRTAAEMSSAAFNSAYGIPFRTEHHLHAYLDYHFRIQGCETPGYLAVVAGGAHALTLHYTRNDDVLRDGDLVLVDAGGRYGGYCADISRTWPVNGKFTAPQRDLYQAVLNVNKACIELCTESAGYSLADLHAKSEDLLYSELANAGLQIARHKLRQLYPHYIGHHLGLDVHDGSTPKGEALKSNQVVTIEPGVYVPDSPDFPEHFRGIGIRIEDNVVVGSESAENLTIDTLKEIDDIEACRE